MLSDKLGDVTIIRAGPPYLFAVWYAGFCGLRTGLIDGKVDLGGQLTAPHPEKYIYDAAGLPIDIEGRTPQLGTGSGRVRGRTAGPPHRYYRDATGISRSADEQQFDHFGLCEVEWNLRGRDGSVTPGVKNDCVADRTMAKGGAR